MFWYFGDRIKDYTHMELEMSGELEDDLFFADLSKQISLLIMDDDDEDPLGDCPSLSLHQVLKKKY